MPDIVAGAIGIAFMALWIYCLYDVITTDEAIIRHLPKVVWLLIVFFLFDIGSLLWLAVGRPHHWARTVANQRKQGTTSGGTPQSVLDDPALDDMSPIVRHREEQARLRMREAQLARREEELRRREMGIDPVDPPTNS
jgi:hypothetical protein